MSVRKRLAVGATAATLGLILGATVLSPVIATAQESTTTTTLASSPPETGENQARPVRAARIRELLEALVTDGTITATQADAVAQHLAAAQPGSGGVRWGRHGGGGVRLEAAAAAIGIEPSALVEALRSGQSIADVATANGVTPEAVIEALVAAHQTVLDKKVADGSLTAEEAAARAANAVERITAMVNGEFQVRRAFPGRPDDASAAESTATTQEGA